ncbi:hypothetical protein DSC45_23650 [Streptomyces sp. YIM 130001]|uniref:FxLYD domain-containing protein n=1 Tax=Streptomyces sp. YIM 130001 TaxID=2259644 RepID=UPI000E645E34|nr:FxLYD domain-containing protein [Streptomyces sp. YIM 130001]RII13348.1 hypothetical protein DSC45_23650 [Streptomyces sp. YIM 130001]
MNRTRKTLIAAASVIALGAGANACAGTVDAETAPSKKPSAAAKKKPKTSDKAKDVKLGKFTVKDQGYGLEQGEAKVTITNHSKKTSDYSITVEFLNKAGERIGEDFAGASSVQPGQVTREKVGALLTTDDLPKVDTVRIAKIARWASL